MSLLKTAALPEALEKFPPAPPETSVPVVYCSNSVTFVMPVSARNSGVIAWIEVPMSRSEVLMRVPESVLVAR